MLTEHDGERSHGAAAEGKNEAAAHVGAVRGPDGDVEVEQVEEAGCTQQRGQRREEGGNSAATTAAALAAATAASTPIRSLLCSSTRLCLALWGPHSQLHTLLWQAQQRPTLVSSALQIGGLRTPSRCVCAVGNGALRGQGRRNDAVFSIGVQIVSGDDRAGKSLIRFALHRLICFRLIWEVNSGLLVV